MSFKGLDARTGKGGKKEGAVRVTSKNQHLNGEKRGKKDDRTKKESICLTENRWRANLKLTKW